LNPNYDVINDAISGFAKVVVERAMRFLPLDSSEDFMGHGTRWSPFFSISYNFRVMTSSMTS